MQYSSSHPRQESIIHQAYEYPPLAQGQIRLLKLHSGISNLPLVVSLDQLDRGASKCSYEAVSYAWGDPKRNISIRCNGAELKVTASLEIALQQIRSSTRDRLLWIDAICINQDDIEERSQQVLLIGGIYSGAAKVLVSLGEMEKMDKLALRVIHKWASFNRQHRDTFDMTRYAKFERHFISKPGHRESLKAVGALTYRPWFNRCWTFQEILLSTDAEIMIGDLHLSWDCFHDALVAFPVYSLIDEALNFNALFMCYGRAKIKKTTSLENSVSILPNLSTLLQMTRNFVTSDPRDKIFSMLGIATLSNRDRFRPNYDMSIQETFISFTLAMIRDEKSLNVMSSAGEFDHEIYDKDFPSWCPDWTSKRDVTLMGYDNYKRYPMGRNYNPNLQNLSVTENFELELEGVLIDVVTETFDLEAMADELKVSIKKGTFPSVLSRYADEFGLPNHPSLDGLNPEGVLLRTLSADHWFFGTQASNYYKERWFPTHVLLWGFQENRPTDDLVQITLMRYQPPTILSPSEIEKIYGQTLPFCVRNKKFGFEEPLCSATQTKIVKEAVDQALFLSKGRRILITQNGLIALGHGETKVGDSLCSFWGADVPFVIRQRNEVDHHCITIPCYQIIGECYINNLMYGELFQHASEYQDANLPRQPVMDKTQLKKIRVR